MPIPLPKSWSDIAAAGNLSEALFLHFKNALGTDKKNLALLERICKVARSAKPDTSDPDDNYHSLVIDFGVDLLRCSRPRGSEDKILPTNAPSSFVKILDLHRRLQLREAQVDLFFEDGVAEEGWLDGTHLEGREDVFSPLRVYADLYIYHPDKKNASGELQLYFLDHEMLEEDGPQLVKNDLPTIFLQHLAKGLNLSK